MRAIDSSWTTRSVPWPENILAAVRAYAAAGEVAWLDTAATGADCGVSLIGIDPVAVLEQHVGSPAALRIPGRGVKHDASAWRLWQSAVGRTPPHGPLKWRLGPGWVGYLGYEMSRQLERLPTAHLHTLTLPLCRLWLFDVVIVFDHNEHRATAIQSNGLREAYGLTPKLLEVTCERWVSATRAVSWPKPADVTTCVFEDRATHEARVRAALERIAAGDIYQVNLAQRTLVNGVDDPFHAYGRLRDINPAGYAALLKWGDGAVLSASPELMLRAEEDRLVTRPIKGTRPRIGDEEIDAVRRRELLASEKDAAELAMIVDLHRNDLGRVSRYGTVQVTRARDLENHPTVMHTVAEIESRLARGKSGLEALMAMFPAGSITGAPKISAMKIIDELESAARGVYTGSIGALGLNGDLTFNVAIRTAQVCEGVASVWSGGGIVAESDPAEEYEETLAKARGLLAALDVPVGAPKSASLREVAAPATDHGIGVDAPEP
ncbi:MAG: anthranilate synthase component I family protein [Phycisphaerales bacterium]|nr:anthranilate synthase component I family protein [Phycisphaerales bacterium]